MGGGDRTASSAAWTQRHKVSWEHPHDAKHQRQANRRLGGISVEPFMRKMFPQKTLGEWDGSRVNHSESMVRTTKSAVTTPLVTRDAVKKDMTVSRKLWHTNDLQSQAEFLLTQSRYSEAAQCLSDAKSCLKKLG